MKVKLFVKGELVIDVDDRKAALELVRKAKEFETVGEVLDTLQDVIDDTSCVELDTDQLKIESTFRADGYTFMVSEDDGEVIYSNY